MLTKELNKIQRYWIRFFKDLILILINNLEMIYNHKQSKREGFEKIFTVENFTCL